MTSTVVVTGGGRGIGYAVAEQLAQDGWQVVLLARDAERGAAACRALSASAGREVRLVVGDLSSPRTTRAAAEAALSACPRIDVFVHNAGVWPTGLTRNEDGHEQAFATNHLAPFLLNHLLERRLVAARARVVQLSAGFYVKGTADPERTPTGADFHPLRTYADSKLCNAKATWKRPAYGAASVVRLVRDPGLAGATGRYFHLDGEIPFDPVALDTGLAHRIWEQAIELTGIDTARQSTPDGR